jgi:hypothetical protein
MSHAKRNLWLRTLLGLIVAGVLLGLVFIRTDFSDTLDALGDARFIYLPPAMLLFALSVWFQALRWRYLLRPLTSVPARRLYPVVFVGHLGNSLIPLRAGEVLRALVVSRREGVSRMAALGTLVVERALDGLTLTAMLLVFVAVVDPEGGLWQLALAGALLFGLATAGLVLIAFNQERCLSIAVTVINRGPTRWRARLRRWFRSFLTGTTALRTPTGMLGVLLSTVGFWLSIAVVYTIVGEAFAINEGFDTYLLVTAAANLSVSIPSSQGGLGPFEFFVRQTLVYSDVAAPVATAYALVLHATLLAAMIVPGAVCLRLVGLSVDTLSETTAGENGAEEPPAATARQAGTSAYRKSGEAGAPPDRA